MTTNTTNEIKSQDSVINLLTKLKWYREPDLVIKGCKDRPVFSLLKGKRTLKFIVGPLWITYYDIHKEVIGEIDSVKLNNEEVVTKIIKELTFL